MASRYRIKSIYCEGMPSNIQYWHLEEPREGYLIEMRIGDVHRKEAGDIFKVLVITPEDLRQIAPPPSDPPIIADRALIVVREYDFKAIDSHLHQIVESCNEPGWQGTLERIRRFFLWEWDGIENEPPPPRSP